VNPIAEGRVSWECVGSCPLDPDEEDECWHNWLSEVTMLNCNMMTKSLCCVTTQVQDLPTYDGLTAVDEFLNKFESIVPEHQWFDALKWALRATPARWWGTQQGNYENWRDRRRMMQLWFGKSELRITEKYDGRDDPRMHLTKWTKAYGEEP